jgi:hypothetical protein
MQLATLIAIFSLIVSIFALIISYRRQSFDLRLAGEKKKTEIRNLFFESQRETYKFLNAINKWENFCRECQFYSDKDFVYYRKRVADSFKSVQLCIRAIEIISSSKKAAINLESITAYCDDLCKHISMATESCLKVTESCNQKFKN